MKQYNSHTRSQEQLPFNPQPTLETPTFYYKIKTQISPQKQIIMIGLQFQHMTKYQEDHFLYLIQIFQTQCKQIRLKIIDRYLIYGEIHIDIIHSQWDNQEYVRLERRLFQMLKLCQQCFNKFIKEQINPYKLLIVGQQSSQDGLKQRFKNAVIAVVKQYEKKIQFQ